jgi:citrate lyase subunit beta/citryl-CoA lyase
MEDLAEVMRGSPDIVALPKVAEPHHVVALDEAVTRFERDYDIPSGSTALLPNVEFARGLVQTEAIAKASRRTAACLLAAEDLAADLGAERGQDGFELAYCGSALSSNAWPPASSRSIVPIPGAISRA